MTRLSRILPVVVLTVAWGLGQDAALSADRTRVFMTLVSHNEEPISNGPCADLLASPERFSANRAAVVALASLVDTKGGAWNFQSEYAYLLLLAEWEQDAEREETGGQNLMRFLDTLAPGRIQVDAHSHELRGYNYADVASLLEQFGVSANGIVGGFIWSPVNRQTWRRLRSPLRGQRYLDYVWTAKTLWGGGSAGHRTDSNASGIWRPKSAEAFHEDDPTQTLMNVGNFPGIAETENIAAVTGLVQRLRDGQLEPGRMYTATFMMPQCTLDVDPVWMTRAAGLLDLFAEDVERGDVVWAPISEMVRVWTVDYNSAPLVWRESGR